MPRENEAYLGALYHERKEETQINCAEAQVDESRHFCFIHRLLIRKEDGAN